MTTPVFRQGWGGHHPRAAESADGRRGLLAVTPPTTSQSPPWVLKQQHSLEVNAQGLLPRAGLVCGKALLLVTQEPDGRLVVPGSDSHQLWHPPPLALLRQKPH